MCCTQLGELAAAGWMTCAGSPSAMDGWACSRPSKIQMTPKPMRSSWRHPGSATVPAGSPARIPGGRSHSWMMTQASASTAKTASTMNA
jgi:hypothetical protein